MRAVQLFMVFYIQSISTEDMKTCMLSAWYMSYVLVKHKKAEFICFKDHNFVNKGR